MIYGIVAVTALLIVVATTAALLVSRAAAPTRVRTRMRAGGEAIAATCGQQSAEASELHVNGGWR